MHRVATWIVRALLIAVAITALQWFLGWLLPSAGVGGDATGPLARYLLQLLSALLLAAPLAYPIYHSRVRGRALWGAVFLAVLGLMTVLTQMEAALFLNMTPGELWRGTASGSVVAAALSWLAVTLYPTSEAAPAAVEHRPNPPSTASWVQRWIGASFAYVLLYITAGLLILPLIRSWYAEQGRPTPNPALLVPLQIVRGALFVAFVLPLLRSMQVRRWQAGLAMAVMIPLLHGVAVLIPPNPFMPDFVRHAHMIEIGWSTFVFGLLIGFLFWNPEPGAPRLPA